MATHTDKPVEVILDIVQRALHREGVKVFYGSKILQAVRAELLPPPPHPLDSVRQWLHQSGAPEGVHKDLQWAYELLANTNPAPSAQRDALTPAEPVPEPVLRVGGAPLPAMLWKHTDGRWYAERAVGMVGTSLERKIVGEGTAPLEAITEYVHAWCGLQDAARKTVEGP